MIVFFVNSLSTIFLKYLASTLAKKNFIWGIIESFLGGSETPPLVSTVEMEWAAAPPPHPPTPLLQDKRAGGGRLRGGGGCGKNVWKKNDAKHILTIGT